MFERILASVAAARTSGEGLRACARLENAACAARLGHMADMLDAAYSASGSAKREQWRFDNWSSVCARIGAAHEVTSGAASGLLTDAVALRERLPQVAKVFAQRLISYKLVHTICTRTMLVTDPGALEAIDRELADLLRTWGAKSREKSEQDIDALVLVHDPYALRRTESACRGAHVDVTTDSANGVAYVTATVSAPEGEAIDKRADVLAHTVCARDPRTLDQRRAAALSAMAFGWDRLPCLCESGDCDATTKPAAGGVVVHVIARQEVVDVGRGPRDVRDGGPGGDGSTTGSLAAQRRALAGENPPLLPRPWQGYTLAEVNAALAADAGECCPARPAIILGGVVLPAQVAAQAAMHATIRPLIHPGQTLAQAGGVHPMSGSEMPLSRMLEIRHHRRYRPHHPVPVRPDLRVESRLSVPRTPLAQNVLAGVEQRPAS